MAKILFLLNDAPYGNERTYNALRLASALAKRPDEQVKIFLIGDAVAGAKAHQKVPAGYYNIELMLRGAVRHGAEVALCSTCMDARGVTDAELTDGTRRGSLEQLTDWTQWADKILVF